MVSKGLKVLFVTLQRYLYRVFDILTTKCFNDTFLKAVESVNTSGVPFLLAFNLKNRNLYLLIVCLV